MKPFSREVTYKAWLEGASRELEKAGVESAYLSAQLILVEVTGETRSSILAHPERSLDQSRGSRAAGLLHRRLLHEPIAYLLGWKEFRNLRIKVRSGVLIPRPETEELIDLAVELAPWANRILDAGTGSGCIPLSLAEFFPQAVLFGCDLSPYALSCARENDIEKRVNWFRSVWLGPVASASMDLVVSNPPYLTVSEMSTLEPQVAQYEPLLALNGGFDGCDCYRVLIPQTRRVLKKGGVFLMECSPSTASGVTSIAQAEDFGEIRIHLDMAGRGRFVSGIRR